jgi:hypothetical protein
VNNLNPAKTLGGIANSVKSMTLPTAAPGPATPPQIGSADTAVGLPAGTSQKLLAPAGPPAPASTPPEVQKPFEKTLNGDSVQAVTLRNLGVDVPPGADITPVEFEARLQGLYQIDKARAQQQGVQLDYKTWWQNTGSKASQDAFSLHRASRPVPPASTASKVLGGAGQIAAAVTNPAQTGLSLGQKGGELLNQATIAVKQKATEVLQSGAVDKVKQGWDLAIAAKNNDLPAAIDAVNDPRFKGLGGALRGLGDPKATPEQQTAAAEQLLQVPAVKTAAPAVMAAVEKKYEMQKGTLTPLVEIAQLGPRPADPAQAQAYDTKIAALKAQTIKNLGNDPKNVAAAETAMGMPQGSLSMAKSAMGVLSPLIDGFKNLFSMDNAIAAFKSGDFTKMLPYILGGGAILGLLGNVMGFGSGEDGKPGLLSVLLPLAGLGAAAWANGSGGQKTIGGWMGAASGAAAKVEEIARSAATPPAATPTPAGISATAPGISAGVVR